VYLLQAKVVVFLYFLKLRCHKKYSSGLKCNAFRSLRYYTNYVHHCLGTQKAELRSELYQVQNKL